MSDEIRLVAMRLVDGALLEPAGPKQPLRDAFDAGITEEEANRAMHVSGSYTAERAKLRNAFSPKGETE